MSCMYKNGVVFSFFAFKQNVYHVSNEADKYCLLGQQYKFCPVRNIIAIVKEAMVIHIMARVNNI